VLILNDLRCTGIGQIDLVSRVYGRGEKLSHEYAREVKDSLRDLKPSSTALFMAKGIPQRKLQYDQIGRRSARIRLGIVRKTKGRRSCGGLPRKECIT
jgi:hypothetical protein